MDETYRDWVLIVYLLVHSGYIFYAYKRAEEGSDIFEKVGRPIGLLLGPSMVVKLVPTSSVTKLKELHGILDIERRLVKYQYGRMGLIYLVLFIGGLFALVIGRDYKPAMEQNPIIERPMYGMDDEVLSLTYEVGEDSEGPVAYVKVLVEGQMPDKAKSGALLASKEEALGQMILDGHMDAQRIEDDLCFSAYPFEEGIFVEYRSLTKEVLSDQGQLKTNLMREDVAYPVKVEAHLTYGKYEVTFVYDYVAYRPYPNAIQEQKTIEGLISTEDKTVFLPTETQEGKHPIQWRTVEEGVSGLQVFFLSCLVGVALYVLKEYELSQSVEKRREEILYDFPEVVNKLTILINAGMTFNRAWYKIVEDYQNRIGAPRVLYEEMVTVSIDVQTGMSEVQAIEAFGKRCQSIEVIRLSSMLVQNLKRGSHSLTDALKGLRGEVWAIRTSNARKLGEKASTKLLIPMAISLITVLLVVIAPTFMKMQL